MLQLKKTLPANERIPHIPMCEAMRRLNDVSFAPRVVAEMQDNPHTSADNYVTVYGCWMDVLSEFLFAFRLFR